MLTCERVINYQIFFKRFGFLQNKSFNWHRLIMTLNNFESQYKSLLDLKWSIWQSAHWSDFVTFSFRRLPFFPNFVRLFDRNLCFTGFQLEGPIRKAFFLSMPCDSMRQKMFSCDFLRFVDISFHFVSISRCVTHSVQRVLVKISFHTSVLICKAETSVFVNKVTVLSCSISGFSIWNIPRSILGG